MNIRNIATRKNFGIMILVISILMMAITILTLVFVGRDRIEWNMPVLAKKSCIATEMVGEKIARVSSSQNALPDWLSDRDQENLTRAFSALRQSNWEALLSYLSVLNVELKTRGHSVNELASQLKWQLMPTLVSGWISRNLSPFLVTIAGILLIGLLHRLAWSPLQIFKWFSRWAGGILLYYLSISLTLLIFGIWLRIWLSEYPDTLAILTELLVWLTALLLAGNLVSLGSGKKIPTLRKKNKDLSTQVKTLKNQVLTLGGTPAV